jgi:hypothetical protein
MTWGANSASPEDRFSKREMQSSGFSPDLDDEI